MAHHAYFIVDEQEAGVARARTYGVDALGLTGEHNPDLITFRYGLCSIENVRRVLELARQAAIGEQKLIILAAERIFHEAQNALLKLFEEPAPGTTLILIVPSTGILLGTLRSRLIALGGDDARAFPEAQTFLAADQSEREKYIAKLLDRAKSDKDDEKQRARSEAIRLVEGLTVTTYSQWHKTNRTELAAFLRDLEHFLPILHERSAPLKLIFEHVLITMPDNLVP